MTALVLILPALRATRASRVCHRCGGRRRVTFDQMSEAQQRWAPFGSIFPCPACGFEAEIIPFEECQRRVGAIMAEG
jgi:hypothetical protein